MLLLSFLNSISITIDNLKVNRKLHTWIKFLFILQETAEKNSFSCHRSLNSLRLILYQKRRRLLSVLQLAQQFAIHQIIDDCTY